MEKALFETKFELKKFDRKEDLSFRATLIKEFTERINEERVGTKYKPLTPRAIAVKVGHLDTWDLDMFLKQCKRAKNFGKTFFWAIKVIKNN